MYEFYQNGFQLRFSEKKSVKHFPYIKYLFAKSDCCLPILMKQASFLTIIKTTVLPLTKLVRVFKNPDNIEGKMSKQYFHNLCQLRK